MSARTLLAIEQSDDGVISGRVVEAPQRVSRRTLPLAFDPSPWRKALADSAGLGEYGRWLRSGLATHPDIRKVLDGLSTLPANALADLHFDINGAAGEAMHWEMLGDHNGLHMAHGGSPRLGRIAYETSTPPLAPQAWPTPVRMLAFLSAAGVSARDEFDNLQAALRFAAGRGLVINATFYVGEPELLRGGRADAPGLKVEALPADTLALQDAMSRQPAHLLHVFCHGRSAPEQLLEFATVADWMGGATEGSAPFAVDRLLACGALKSAWIAMFNCCDGGKPTEALNSMAYRAVAAVGTPAAIGMGAPIPAAAASIFSRAFYTALFAQLVTLSQQRGSQAVDVCAAVTEGRLALHQQLTGAERFCTAWALPIVNLHREPFVLEVGAQRLTEAAAAKLATVAGYLNSLPADAPEPMRKAIWALFDADPLVPLAFRPNLQGLFPAVAS